MNDSLLEEYAAAHNVNLPKVKAALKTQRVETPSWGFGDSGTRFRVFHQPGAARDIHEKLADAALVHRLTGICPSVAIHIPWDKVDDWAALRQSAASLGLGIGAVNPNLFLGDAYAFGSICHPSPGWPMARTILDRTTCAPARVA
jgi:L-rhamnose isomerase/sugar isomerase